LDGDQRLASFYSFLPLFTIPSKFGILWGLLFIPRGKNVFKSDLGLSLTFFFFFLNTYDLIFSVVTSDH
jgi:hypothetical protein